MIFMKRIWHKDLVSVLPDKLLLKLKDDWFSIATDLVSTEITTSLGEPVIDRILEYSIGHFYTYYFIYIMPELHKRGLLDAQTLEFFHSLASCYSEEDLRISHPVFDCWHNTRYLLQCLMYLEELYDCGEISFEEWYRILNKTRSMHAYCEETYQSLFV